MSSEHDHPATWADGGTPHTCPDKDNCPSPDDCMNCNADLIGHFNPADVSAPEPDYYRDGLRYVDGLVDAVDSARAGDFNAASAHAYAADCVLAPLGEENDADGLRDFIAGTAFAAEHYLRQLGIHIVADGPGSPLMVVPTVAATDLGRGAGALRMPVTAFDHDTLPAHLENGGEATCRCGFLTTRFEPGLGEPCKFETVVYDYGPHADSSPYVFETAIGAAAVAIDYTDSESHWGACDGSLH